MNISKTLAATALLGSIALSCNDDYTDTTKPNNNPSTQISKVKYTNETAKIMTEEHQTKCSDLHSIIVAQLKKKGLELETILTLSAAPIIDPTTDPADDTEQINARLSKANMQLAGRQLDKKQRKLSTTAIGEDWHVCTTQIECDPFTGNVVGEYQVFATNEEKSANCKEQPTQQ